jgi:hypothetical protein
MDLMRHLGTVKDHGNSEFTFSVGLQHELFKKPHGSELEVEEAARLRRFLRHAAAEVPSSPLPPPSRMIVVIDHHAAHIYRDAEKSLPEDEHTVKPYDPYGFHHHLIHKKEAHYRGERVPEENSFYEEVAMALHGAMEIVVIGHGTGTSSAAVHLGDYLKTHHPDLFAKILAAEDADLSALTAPEIEALARKHMLYVVEDGDGQPRREGLLS